MLACRKSLPRSLSQTSKDNNLFQTPGRTHPGSFAEYLKPIHTSAASPAQPASYQPSLSHLTPPLHRPDNPPAPPFPLHTNHPPLSTPRDQPFASHSYAPCSHPSLSPHTLLRPARPAGRYSSSSSAFQAGFRTPCRPRCQIRSLSHCTTPSCTLDDLPAIGSVALSCCCSLSLRVLPDCPALEGLSRYVAPPRGGACRLAIYRSWCRSA